MRISKWIAWVLALALIAGGTGSALAAADPTLDQIYQAANSGRLSEAQAMTDQVLKDHPNSAKAHYVKAELAARQGDATVAKQELATAERIAPGLPFAKPEAVRALQTQVSDLSAAPARRPVARQMGGSAAPQAGPSLPWGKLLLGAGIVLAIVALMRRRPAAPAGYGTGAAPNGAGPYGSGTPTAGGMYGQGPGMPGTGPYPYGAPGAAPSMGSTLGRGLATGLAVGAGAVAAEEIGRRMFDHRGNPIAPDAMQGGPGGNNFGLSDPSSIDNPDMGGQDFGVNDVGSWDDGGGGGGDIGGGGDWDT